MIRSRGCNQMSSALLTIITPVLNGARFLPDAIESVAQAARRGVPIEHVIVDGGSHDDSVEIARKAMSRLGSPITRVLTGPDTGQANAINRGIAASRGTFVSWLNADDVLVPEGISNLASVMRESLTDVVLGRCRFVDLAGRTVYTPTPPDPVTPESLLRLLSGWFAGRSIVQPEAFVRREFLERFGGVEESLHYTMDHHLWVRLAAAGAVFQAEPIEVARQLVHPGQKTADNIAVAKEMLTYAEAFLAERSETQERERARREIRTVAVRVKRAGTMTSVLDRVLRSDSGAQSVVIHGQCLSIPHELLREWARTSRRHQTVLLAGLDQKNRSRFMECCPSKRPPVIVGRLLDVSAQFDLVVASRAGFEGVPPGFDATRLLKPGGKLCVLGATPGGRLCPSLRSIRRAIADRVTFDAHTLLDEPVSEGVMSNLNVLGKFREFELPPTCRVRFIPDSAAGSVGYGAIAQRLGLQDTSALSGLTIVEL